MPSSHRKKTSVAAPAVPRGPGGKWLPGQSPNPGGRAPESYQLMERAKHHGPRMLDYLVSVVEGAEPEAKVGDKIKAAVEVLNRGFGQPRQDLAVAGLGRTEDGRPRIVVEHVHVGPTAE